MVLSLLIVVILLFGIYTFRVGTQAGGYKEFFKVVLSNGPSRQVTIDLYICLTLISIWIYFDAARIGLSMIWVTGYYLLTLFMGSFGPLFYLIHRQILLMGNA